MSPPTDYSDVHTVVDCVSDDWIAEHLLRPVPEKNNTIKRVAQFEYEKIPQALVEFMQGKLVMGTTYKYRHVSPYVSRNVFRGWHAQRKISGIPKKIIRIGLFRSQLAAAIATAATYIDKSLLSEPLLAKKWFDDVCSNEAKLTQWILQYSTPNENSFKQKRTYDSAFEDLK